MGRVSHPTGGYRDDPDAVSLHTTPDDYSYDDAPEISGLPPSYEDSEAGSSAAVVPIRHLPPPTTRTNHNNPTFKHGKPYVCETVDYMDPRYDTDAVFLEAAIRSCAQVAPVPLIYIMGTHKEAIKKGDKKNTQEVTDFRIVINMQRYLRRDFDPNDTSSMNLDTVDNGEKTHRGTITKVRAPGVKQDIEVGSGQKPSLTEWCHRYCASPRMLRTFRLRRVVTGFDETHVKNRLDGVIRSTNYRGHISITFPVEDKNVDFHTSNRINQWRLKAWVCWFFYLTFLWIFTWPYLFFATKRYAVVRAEWPFSAVDANGRKTYKTVTEEQWFEKWHVAVRRLALDRYQGEANEEMMSGVIARPEDPPMPGTIRTGHEGVDTAVGFLTQGFQVARAIQGGGLGGGVQGGWGYDC
ncbi:hypothetical protein P153DRAFT_363629 [Dothidotthia symphoricarpi CBS 119687]|uniref:Uncharacterized protein n=1 Tax=Dothidotthia symphoricarpi CBS 119687 TaxID=1392245 RepID=A0A6A6AQG9_9PLEO|nr:uncharacterized protein P153DRAFT_363629 [Dothidotthia symphoricarpi CBS 119687]KAF2133443.1 hypothetical protein P153DRAFT_363629 [Dothidotthia symphoricarpi CBS 119687]